MNFTNVTVLIIRSAMSFINMIRLPYRPHGEKGCTMAKCDGIFYTKPGRPHSDGYLVFDLYDDEPKYLGWAEDWLKALVIYHCRITDTDGECCVMIFKCRTTDLPCLWGKAERMDCDA